MDSLVVQNPGSGIAQTWLIATAGAKQIRKRVMRKEISDIYIPEICEEVSNIAAQAHHLRLTSNLLYGLSLIYKHKVTYMETDTTLAYDRIATPLFRTALALQFHSRSEEVHKIPDSRVYHRNDDSFDIETDFVPIWTDACCQPGSKRPKGAFEPYYVELGRFGDGYQRPSYVDADERDKSFDAYLNKTTQLAETSGVENLDVDFEFNNEGQIIGRDNGPQGSGERDILKHLNLDEDLNAVTTSIEDLSKSANSLSNDPHFTTTLNQSLAIVRESDDRQTKRRRVRVRTDEVTSTRVMGVNCDPSVDSDSHKQETMRDMFRCLSLSQPAFVNQAFRFFLGDTVTAGMAPSSLSQNHFNNFELMFREMGDVEQGRNLPSRRVSENLDDRGVEIGEAIAHSPFIASDDLMFNFQPISPLVEERDNEGQCEEGAFEYQNKLLQFRQFIEDRITALAGSQSNSTLNGSRISLESLIPSRGSEKEEAVSRKLAANSFSFMLQLAGNRMLTMRTTNELRPARPEEIEIEFRFSDFN